MVIGNVVGFFVDYNLIFKYCFKSKASLKSYPNVSSLIEQCANVMPYQMKGFENNQEDVHYLI